jgi:hypothetical protein
MLLILDIPLIYFEFAVGFHGSNLQPRAFICKGQQSLRRKSERNHVGHSETRSCNHASLIDPVGPINDSCRCEGFKTSHPAQDSLNAGGYCRTMGRLGVTKIIRFVLV